MNDFCNTNFKKGIMCHYLAVPASTMDAHNLSIEKWNKQIDAFDVNTLVQQIARSGVDYLILTLGQNSGFFISPNSTYDKLVGRIPSRCSERDIIQEVAQGLDKYNIKMIVYLPSHAPAGDLQAVTGLSCTPAWDASLWQLKPDMYEVLPDIDTRLSVFQRNWEAIIREWSIRWGKLVEGWWFDGCYYGDIMYQYDDEPNFNSFATAAKSGNPGSIITFNKGLLNPLVVLPVEDYTSGEYGAVLPVSFEPDIKSQLHILTYMGEYWGRGKNRFSAEFIAAYTQHVNDNDGMMTWDMPIQADGTLQADALAVMEDAKEIISFYSEKKAMQMS